MLHQSFFEKVREQPDRIALSIGGVEWTYAELGAAAMRITCTLGACGLRNRPVALFSAKSATVYAGMLGILAARNVYVPLNGRMSDERNSDTLESTGCPALIVDAASHDRIVPILRRCSTPLTVLLPDVDNVPACFDDPGPHRFVACGTAPEGAAAFDDEADDATRVAYIIQTSGSTGRPKGVPVRHESIDACIASLQALLALVPDDRCSQFAELSFDFSIGEIFLCWRAGATLCVPTEAEQRLPFGFAVRNRLSVWSSVPTLAADLLALRLLRPDSLPGLRVSYFCGEALPAALARAWGAAAPNSMIANLYGPTEAAVFATFHLFDAAASHDFDTVPIGAPFDTVACLVEDDNGRSPEPGEVGELLLGGVQVADGYLGDASATAFVRDHAGTRWYRTGDLVSRHPVHGLLFHGRADRQVKVRGLRVELQDVESQIARIIGCDQIAVLPAMSDDGRCETLVAICAFLPAPDAQLRSACTRELPAPMVPRRFYALEQFPRSINGKLDLPALRRLAQARGWLSPQVPEAGT